MLSSSLELQETLCMKSLPSMSSSMMLNFPLCGQRNLHHLWPQLSAITTCMYELLKQDGQQADTFVCSLKSHYNEQVKRLGQTSAGLTVEVLQGGEKTRGLLSKPLSTLVLCRV